MSLPLGLHNRGGFFAIAVSEERSVFVRPRSRALALSSVGRLRHGKDARNSFHVYAKDHANVGEKNQVVREEDDDKLVTVLPGSLLRHQSFVLWLCPYCIWAKSCSGRIGRQGRICTLKTEAPRKRKFVDPCGQAPETAGDHSF